jgi:predicted MFS family arabinose efflux permease
MLFAFVTPGPHHPMAIISISIASIGIYGMMTLGYVMVNKNCGQKAKGSVMGISALSGAVAILIIAKAGGVAFDKVHKNAPFVGAAICSFILLLVNLIPCVRDKVNKQNDI